MWSLLALIGLVCEAHALKTIGSTSLCTGCLQEPLETEYFGGTMGGEPPRLNLQDNPNARAIFDEAARAGKVLIIEGAAKGTALEGWSCKKLAEELPGAKMRKEYDWDENPEDENRQRMGDTDWIDTREEGEDAEERKSQDPKSPPFAPYYWGVREYQNGQVGDRATVQKVMGLIKNSVPSFMAPQNANSLVDNAEFWLGAKGTGARAHMDSHCISTLSVVMHGKRRWRIGPPPRMSTNGGKSSPEEVVFDDGVAYKLRWKPMYEFTVKQGEALLFPPGWLHETYNVAEGCTAALTTQFDYPRPMGYFRSYYNRVRRVGDLGTCWRDIKSAASHGAQQDFAKADANGDGKVTRDEMGGNEMAFDFFAKSGTSERLIDVDEATQIKAKWASTEQAISKEPIKRAHNLGFDMSLAPSGREDL